MDKYGVLNFNLNDNTSPQMKIQFLILVVLFSFQVTVGLSLPFLFYHPNEFECEINGAWTKCSEQQMCQNKYPYRYLSSEKVHSISMEFNLFCGANKVQESFMLSLTLIGQAAGFLMSMLFDIPKPHKAKMMLFTVIIEFLILGSVKVLVLNTFFLTIILSAWNFIFAFYFGQQYAYICDVYSATINNAAPVVLGFFQPFLGLIYLVYANANGYWKDHLINFTAFPLLIVGCVWYFSYDYRQDELEQHKEEKSKIAKIDTNNFIQDMLYKYNELITHPKLLINFIMYILCWFNSNMAYTSSFLVFNDIQTGSFMKNLVVSQLTDCVGALIAWFLFRTYPSRNVMFGSSLVAGIIQVGTQGLGSNPGYWVEMGPILVAKAYKSLMVGGLLIVTPQLVPFRYLLVLFTFSNIVTLGLASLMPFYKMFMDSIQVNVFVGFGILSFISCYYIRKWTYKEDIGIIETYDPNAKKDKAAQMQLGGQQPIRGAQKADHNDHSESLLK